MPHYRQTHGLSAAGAKAQRRCIDALPKACAERSYAVGLSTIEIVTKKFYRANRINSLDYTFSCDIQASKAVSVAWLRRPALLTNPLFFCGFKYVLRVTQCLIPTKKITAPWLTSLIHAALCTLKECLRAYQNSLSAVSLDSLTTDRPTFEQLDVLRQFAVDLARLGNVTGHGHGTHLDLSRDGD